MLGFCLLPNSLFRKTTLNKYLQSTIWVCLVLVMVAYITWILWLLIGNHNLSTDSPLIIQFPQVNFFWRTFCWTPWKRQRVKARLKEELLIYHRICTDGVLEKRELCLKRSTMRKGIRLNIKSNLNASWFLYVLCIMINISLPSWGEKEQTAVNHNFVCFWCSLGWLIYNLISMLIYSLIATTQ